jgi:hypothetical protein
LVTPNQHGFGAKKGKERPRSNVLVTPMIPARSEDCQPTLRMVLKVLCNKFSSKIYENFTLAVTCVYGTQPRIRPPFASFCAPIPPSTHARLPGPSWWMDPPLRARGAEGPKDHGSDFKSPTTTRPCTQGCRVHLRGWTRRYGRGALRDRRISLLISSDFKSPTKARQRRAA